MPLVGATNIGDWTVTTTEVYENQTIVITGNLVVKAGGNLTLINCTILVNCSRNGQYYIKVESGGTMKILGSNITTLKPKYKFLFYVYGKLTMRNSFLTRCGYNQDYPGLLIQTDEGVLLKNCTITDCYCGVFCANSSNIIISNCTINNNLWNPIRCINASNVTIYGCMLRDNDGTGIYCENTSNAAIFNSTLSNNVNGIVLYNSSDVLISNCLITGASDYGIVVDHYSSNITIYNCTITNNRINGISILYYSSKVNISNCKISNSSSGWCDVFAHYSSNITILNCVISSNSCENIELSNTRNAIIKNNVFIGGGIVISGYEFQHFASHAIENNTVNGKPLYCIVNATDYTVPTNAGQILIINCTNVFVSGVNISQISKAVQIVYSSNVEVRYSILSNNYLKGIYCCNSSNIVLVNCTVDKNEDIGVYFSDSRNITICNCTIRCNNGSGVCIYNSENVSILECLIVDNNKYGLKLYYLYYVNISRSLIVNNNDSGIYCYDSWGVEIHYCDIYSNTKHGLYADNYYFVNAAYCWWGDPSGPEYKSEGDLADPEEVYSTFDPTYLAYEPWLTEPVMPDTEIPNVEVIDPENNSYVCNVTTIKADAADNIAVDRIEFYANSVLICTDYYPPYECKWNTTGWEDGVYVLNVTAYDASQNSNYTTIYVTVDNTAPDGRIVSPTGGYVSGTVEIEVYGNDANLREIRLYINGTLAASWVSPGTHTYTWGTSELADGPYVIRLEVEDLAGNVNVSAVSVTVDNTAPDIGLIIRLPETPAEGQNVIIEVEVRDFTSGVDKVLLWYRVNNGTWISIEMTYSNGTWVGTIPGQTAGAKVEYYIEAHDRAGNVVKSDIMFYEVEIYEHLGPETPEGPLWVTLLIIGVGGAIAASVTIYLLKRSS